MAWTKKYKRRIDCKRPRGFSQKQYCKGRKKSRKLRGGATPYTIFFHEENGELEPPPFNPFAVNVEDGQSLRDHGFHVDKQEAYSDNDKTILINPTESLSSQIARIPNQIIHVFPKGKAVLEVN